MLFKRLNKNLFVIVVVLSHTYLSHVNHMYYSQFIFYMVKRGYVLAGRKVMKKCSTAQNLIGNVKRINKHVK